MLNGIELFPKLWFFTIHGRNPELIHLLERNNVRPDFIEQIYVEQKIIEKDYFEQNMDYIYNKAIICHHNEIVDYIENNLMAEKAENTIETDNNVTQKNISKVFNFFKNLFKKDEVVAVDNNMKQPLVYKIIPANHTIFKSHNYQYMKIEPNNAYIIKLLLKYDYLKMVKFLYDKEIINSNDKIILKYNLY